MGWNPVKTFNRFVNNVTNAVTGVIGEVISWFVDVDIPEIDRSLTINKQSNNAQIPLIYGEQKIGGTRVFVAVGGENNKYLYVVLVLCEGEINGVGDVFINDIPLSDSRFSGTIVNAYTGTDDQTADTMLVNANVGWTSDHRLRGIAYLAMRFEYNPDVFSSIPEVTAVVQGKKVYNLDTEVTEYSTNPAYCLGDYLFNSRYGKGLPLENIDIPSFIAAANKCDELVAKYSGAPSSEPIFKCNTTLDTSKTVFDNVKIMLSGMRGLLPFSNGKYRLIVEDDTDPVFAFDESNILGDLRISSNSKANKYNRVEAKFRNPDANWQTDTAIWPPSGSTEESTFLSEDNGFELTTTINLLTITDYYAARDIARILCLESRLSTLAVSFVSTTDAMKCEVGDIVTVTHSTPAWDAKEFRVTSIRFSDDGEVVLSLREHTASVYPWVTGAEAEAVQSSTLPDPFTVQPPTNVAAQATVIQQPDGTTVPVFNVTWTASADAYVIEYEVQYQTGAGDFISLVTRETNAIIQNVIPTSDYVIRVRAVNSMGARSDFASISGQTAVADTTAPDAPTGLTATGALQSIELDWNGNTEPDLRGYYIYENTVNNSSTATKLGLISADVFTRTNLADSATRYYWVSAVDYSGNESSKSSVASATTDGGITADDTKAANGYVYYSVNTASQPSKPSASSYNFSTGAFSGLTANWSIQPLAIDGGDGDYWAASWSVLDVNGSQTIVFSNAFKSYEFDGLVTFTNLNNELSDPNSTEITTISGGLIKTGTVDADRIQLDNNTIEASGSGIRIKNLGVDTLQIANNAVTVPDAVFTNVPTSFTTPTAGAFHRVQELVVSSTAGIPNLITFSCHAFTNTKEQFVIGLAVEYSGTSVGLIQFGSTSIDSSNEVLPNTTAAGSVIHTPPTTTTYTYVVYLYHGQAGKLLKANARSISRINIKK